MDAVNDIIADLGLFLGDNLGRSSVNFIDLNLDVHQTIQILFK